MVQYTLAQSPEVILTVPGKDSSKARNKAMDQLIELMESGQLPTDLSEGFGPHQFIEVKESVPVNPDEDAALAQAIQVLNNLAILKQKAQAARLEALQIRGQIDLLFTEELLGEDDFNHLKDGLKLLKGFAHLNLRYQEARAQAEDARTILDQALKSPDQ